MNSFYIEIITPRRTFFEGEINQVIVETIDGLVGIMAGHSPCVAAVNAGVMKLQKADGEWIDFATGLGVVVVDNSRTQIVVETAEWADEIEVDKIKENIEKMNNAEKSDSYKDYLLKKLALARSFARLRVRK